MYCKKCKYHGSDHLKSCPKCGTDWGETRKSLHLDWLATNGHDWLTQDKEQEAPAKNTPSLAKSLGRQTTQPHTAPSAAPKESFEIAPPKPKEQAFTPDPGITVSNLPDLDFSSDAATKTPQAQTPPKQPAEDDLLLGGNDIVELDFSASFDAPAPSASAPRSSPATPKKDDLFIPELEEMLTPLDDGKKTPQATSHESNPSEDDDILLDFGPGKK